MIFLSGVCFSCLG